MHVLSLYRNFENTVELLKITQGGGGVKTILDGNMGRGEVNFENE